MFISFCMHSCSNDTDGQPEFSKDEISLIKEYSFVGVEHNQIMSEIYNELKGKSVKSSTVQKENVISITKQKTEKILQSKDIYNQKVINFDKFYIVNLKTQSKTRSDKANELYIDSVINSIPSSQFKQIVHELIRVSNDNSLSIKEHKLKVDQLNKTAFSTLTREELGYFLAGSSTACASFEYWHENIQDWIGLFANEINTIPRLKSSSESSFWNPVGGGISDGMTGADVGGAVAGAITGAVGGAVAGGIGAGPGAGLGAVAGGVGASTGKVVENIYNYLFD